MHILWHWVVAPELFGVIAALALIMIARWLSLGESNSWLRLSWTTGIVSALGLWGTGLFVELQLVPIILSTGFSILVGLLSLVILRLIILALAALFEPLGVLDAIFAWLVAKVVLAEISTSKAWLLNEQRFLTLLWVGKLIAECFVLWIIGRYVQTTPLWDVFYTIFHHLAEFPAGFAHWMDRFQHAWQSQHH